MAYTLQLKEGDIEPDVEITVTDETGAVVDVTGCTITFSMWPARAPATVKVNDGAGAVVDGPAGRIKYAWQAADTDTPGTYEAEFLVTPGVGLGEPMHCPTEGRLVIIIEEAIGVP